MNNARIYYRLMNDLLRYLLKYGVLENFAEADVEQALAESDRICAAYEKAPDGIGYLARRMCVAINSHFSQLNKKERRSR